MNWRVRLVFFAFLLAICVPSRAEKVKFSLAVHVESSDYSLNCSQSACFGVQKLKVTLDGKKYILVSEDSTLVNGINARPLVLKNGDYAARIATDEAEDAGEYHRVIEIQVAEGVIKRYTVIGESES